MGTILASAIIDKVAGSLLNDRAKIRFTQTDLLESLNEACRFIASVAPDASSNVVAFTCVAGSRQALPAAYAQLLGASYNLGSDGVTPGRIIDVVKRETIDVPDPNWRTRTTRTQVRHIIANDELPTVFDVYPPVVNGTKIAIQVSTIPISVTAGQAIPLDDTYETPIMNYVLSRAFQKNAEYGDNLERAAAYYQAVVQYLQMRAQVDPASSAESATRGTST